jgi:predicted nucleotidyltransferase
MVPCLAGNQAAVEELCHRCKVRRLGLFGSAVKGQERPGESDLDFLVEFERMPPGTYADAYFDLLEGLQQLFGRPVEL